MKKFKVGKSYEPLCGGFDPIEITKRTEKTIWVNNGNTQWSMRIRIDENGNEYVIDSRIPKKWRFTVTYNAQDEV